MQLGVGQHQAEPEKKKRRMTLKETAIVLAAAAVVALLARLFIFQVVTVDGASMQATLMDGERVAVLLTGYWFEDPQRGDVVMCRYPQRNERYIKRVIGLPGEMIMIRQGVVYVDGRPLAEGYVAVPADQDYGPTRVAQGSYFLMGDNRPVSGDSRLAAVGPLPLSMIEGRAAAVLAPFNRIRLLQGGGE